LATPTPMLRQYRQIKARYPDALVLYRLGDFYELFQADAETVARQLGLVLTTRRFAKGLRLPMCGIPYHRLTSYLARLIQLGHKVAIVEQLEDARKTKRLVKRDVVRVITPGTVVEDALLREREENLLVGVAVSATGKAAAGYGLAIVDLSTGKFAATQMGGTERGPSTSDQGRRSGRSVGRTKDTDSTFWEEMARLCPSEIVCPRTLADDPSFLAALETIHPTRLSPLDDAEFVPEVAAERLRTHLGVTSLEAFGCDGLPLAIAAAGGVLHYLQSNQISDLAHIVRLSTYDLSAYMTLDVITRRNLELVRTLRDGRPKGSVYESIDRTLTAMGGRMLRNWLTQPLLDVGAINDRQDGVDELVHQALTRAELRQALDGLYDVERLVGRIGFGTANARDLVALRQTLERVPRIQALLDRAESARLRRLNGELDTDTLARVVALIAQAIVDDPPILLREGGLIRPGYEPQLEQLRQTARTGRDWMAQFEAQERERTGIKNLRVHYNQVFGFFIEVTKSNLDRVPSEYERRATVRNAERFVTSELKAHEVEILAAEDRIAELEYDLFAEVRQRVAAESASLTRAAHTLAELDVLASLAEVAAVRGYVRPTVDEGSVLAIQEGRHPVVEYHLPDGERFVPNDTHLDRDERLMILTGPNMSGKSVYIRQVALIVLLAQIGSFVPAAQAHIGLVDRIFVRAGASDDITQGRSTFLVEMSETSYILNHASERSLVILDEVGRGTSTYDGMSIAWAVAEELHDNIGARTLFATHFHELTALVKKLQAAHNYSLAVTEREREVIFLRQLVPGGADRSYGVQVARLAGLPERVIERATAILDNLETGQRPGRMPHPDAPRSISNAQRQACVIQETQADRHLEDAPEPDTVNAERRTSIMPEREGLTLDRVDETAVWNVLGTLCRLDIANMTPVQALVLLNELHALLMARKLGAALRIDPEGEHPL
jgi:DNA mismatch repair protein MutS